MDVFSLFFFAGFLQGIIIGIPQFLKKNKTTASILLGIWMLLFSIDLLVLFLMNQNIYIKLPFIINTTLPFTFAYGVFYYLHNKYILQKKTTFQKKDLLHFIPLVLVYLTLIPFYTMPAEAKIQSIQNTTAGFSMMGLIITIIRVAHGNIYIILGLKKIKIFKQSWQLSQAKILPKEVLWLKYIGIFQFIIWGTAFVSLVLSIVNIEAGNICSKLIWLFASISLFAMGYILFNSQTVLPERPKSPLSKSINPIRQSQIQKIETLMITDKVFLNPDLSLPLLAELSKMTKHELSYIINAHYKKNFFHFVNEYRILEAQKLLIENSNKSKSILEIAFESGFNSKSSFNTLFKQKTLLTPSNFRKKSSTL